MNKLTLGILIAVAVLVVIGGTLAIIARNHSQTTSPPASGTTFPSAGTSSTTGGTDTTKTIAAANGTSITVRDFQNDSGVIHNPNNNPDYDILVGTDDPTVPTPPYEIDYSGKDQSFGITLYQEPLGDTRKKAEQDLMRRLGINQSQMCSLTYVLAVGPGVNDTYAGDNLGFSFCPNAVQLPY